ncbi:Plant glycogenin-like starch initiation protein 2 isoform 1 [Hibiscus syriacus]|uniref:Plant glycogenin-like starch initiation protein 2 isoform 1 n=1 Tax=Hibiscus syriacus TaxID=106335 RepID=A0A6A2WXD2_HIBSY|nr:uncharacterized protein LOC120180426 [Hibiscus syriacus]KAE8666572.1 Plant glycogenin-like starch initiation protein 2 isoform 1 [Hibiscus syriacus]
MDLLVSGWNLKQLSIPVSPSLPLVPPASPFPAATTCSCSFYKSRVSARKVSSPFRAHPLDRNSNKSSPPFVIYARKKNTKSEPPLEPTLVEEVSIDEEDEQLFFDDFEDDEAMMDEDDDFFEQEFAENDTELYVGDGAGGGGISLAGTWWDKEALLLAEEVCQSFGGDLGIYAFKTLSNSSIQVRVERLTNKSGSPSMEDIEAFSVSYREKLDEAELARSVAENITLEVSSPGVERVVRIPEDLDRFKDRSLYVKYVTEMLTAVNCQKLMVFSGLSLLTWKQNVAPGVWLM